MTEWDFIAGNSVVNRYVRSLYNVAVKSGAERQIAEEFYNIKSYILDIKNYDKFLKKASLLTDYGINFVEYLKIDLQLSSYMINFLNLLLRNKRISMILSICDAYKIFLGQINGEKKFYITVAKDISDSLIKQITEYFENVFGKNAKCIVKQDASLIDGMKVQYRSKVLDYSLKSRLKRLNCAIRGEGYEN